MSDPKLVSPLLDGFAMGAPMSSHNGVRCCPALKETSDTRYIVKIISIPASQVQLDALLLTGAYKESAAALEYFRELSESILKEAAALKNLSKLEGFLSYEDWQVVPMDRGELGYEVYLLGTYKQTLEKFMRRNSMTHLGAINLGIDICAALSAARRAGWIYADLKPTNIFISENKEFRIGDLGLMELDGLDLATLPGMYRSAYTAPELADDMLSPNTTIDTYALGVILYQIYNDGALPQVKHPTEDVPSAPANADYELSEIILKAIAPNPADRYSDPAEMGQALVAYMQRNTVNDVPVIPPLAPIPEDAPEAAPETAVETVVQDETLPGTSEEDVLPQEEISPELETMISQAEELISHPLPTPPAPPEPVSLETLEEQIFQEAPDQAEEFDIIPESVAMPALQVEPPVAVAVDKDRDLGEKRRRTRRKAFLISLITGLFLALLGCCGFLFYTEYYLLTVDSLTVTGEDNRMSVVLDTQIDNSLLMVTCTDSQGKVLSSPVLDGRADFENLAPDMLYKIQVEVEGFHRLDGSTSHAYITPAETKLCDVLAVTGAEDGSVILTFAVEGPDSDSWTITYSAEGEAPVSQTFTGHTATVSGLTVGQTYTFRLEPVTDLFLTGENSLEFTAASIILAENVQLHTDDSGALQINWDTPEGIQVESWHVRCYSLDGYEQQLNTNDLSAVFQDISSGSAYTVEITAAGMTQPVRASITADPIHITGIRVNADNPMNLSVSWDFTGTAPEAGWLLLYTIDGGSPQVVQCARNSGVIEIRVPAATYEFTIQAADGRTVFDGSSSYETADAALYRNAPQAFYSDIQQAYFFVNLIKTPETAKWTHNHVSQADYTTTFHSGDPISVFMYYMQDFYIRHENITVLYVLRDENGKVLADHIGIQNLDWRDDMWRGPNYHYCGLDIPSVPTAPGNYSLDVYFNGLAITDSVDFTITE